ncbi:uncharacterized protein PAN0_007d3262 [Moesziomyces antarcticus]|uniref:Zn(2)-C6 fungal-type domain-containing protein n=2 Tax=Pseudozyma antarctica TaxID=84753 RepID=A0A081CEE9_PSEA2|nr:uncharacterized protein PAN0_007d3262 [Moesziomyces antarcticus]GAK65045.1 conserved hypothetical protein [Moesziomyces antarcticus]
MDRPPFPDDPRASAPRSSASRPQAADAQRGSDRLPPVLPTSNSLPAMPFGRSERLPPLSHAHLPPIKEPDVASFASHRAYAPSLGERHGYDALRRPSPPGHSVPVGMVSADYTHSRRSPGESGALPYHPTHLRHPDPYRQEPPTTHVGSHAAHHMRYDAPSAHMRHPSELEPIASGTPIKRPRVSLACLACRNRKSRCDGVRPTCKTCANMKIDCKWPEVDFRRAKTGDAARTRKRSPAGPSGQRSPESLEHRSRPLTDIAAEGRGLVSSDRHSDALASSPSLPALPMGAALHPRAGPQATSPVQSRIGRYRTHSDGDRDARYADPAVSRSPSERHLLPPYARDGRADLYDRMEAQTRPYSSGGVPGLRLDPTASWMREERTESHPHDVRTPYDSHPSRPVRGLPELRMTPTTAALMRCRQRAAEVAVLARPAIDPQRTAVEAHLLRERSLEDLADRASPGERLDRAFAADWQILGGLSPNARRPFMDVAAGIVGIIEIFGEQAPHGVAPSPPQDARLHTFRLRAASALQPDLRHVSVALDLSPQQKDDLLEASSSAYDTLSYAVPVDRLSWPLSSSVRRALTVHATESAQAVGATQTSPVHPSALPASDAVPFLRQEDVKPPQKVLELCFAAYTRAVGEQVPGLDTEVVAQRIRDGSISALLANAMCAIGASLYERAGERLPVAEALGSKMYLRRSRALIGGALQNPDLEAILALGVMAIRDILMGEIVSSAAIVSSAMRLCMQLDLHRTRASTPPTSADGQEGAKKQGLRADDVFWMIYCLDRITAIATARPLAIKDHEIDTPFPATLRKGQPSIFAALVRQLHYLGRLAEVAISAPVGPGSNPERQRVRDAEIAAAGADLVGHYESLPSVLQLSPANLERAQSKGEALSFLQLHLTHNMALLHRFLLSEAHITLAEHDAMRSAVHQTAEICRLGEAFNPDLLADTPLSAVACFLAGCASLSEIEYLQEVMELPSRGEDRSRAQQMQLDHTQADMEQLLETMGKHAKLWPVALRLVSLLETQMHSGASAASSSTVSALVAQVEAVHVVVRRPAEASDRAAAKAGPVLVRRIHDLEILRAVFPHLC